uniref:Uncharacterized protein n=1 Tax=viral metagenome TaxID=1070528 RepID=A0A6C0CJ88_9ZZZZ
MVNSLVKTRNEKKKLIWDWYAHDPKTKHWVHRHSSIKRFLTELLKDLTDEWKNDLALSEICPLKGWDKMNHFGDRSCKLIDGATQRFNIKCALYSKP